MTIANLTNGLEEKLTEKQLKKILLTTMPKDMQTNWIKNTGKEITEQASYDEQIQTYFNAQKVQMDSASDKSCGGTNDSNKFSTGGRGRGRRYNSNPGRGRDSEWISQRREEGHSMGKVISVSDQNMLIFLKNININGRIVF